MRRTQREPADRGEVGAMGASAGTGAGRGAAAGVLVAAALWGLSGTVAQYLMQRAGLPLPWLATARMAGAGVVLIGLAAVRGGVGSLLGPWRRREDALRLVAFAVLGLFLVQYSYLAAILAANAAAATVIQYSGSGLVVLWASVTARRLPGGRQLGALAATLVGIGLLATNGQPDRLALPAAAIAWGLVSAVTLALYTLLPRPLLHRHDTLVVVGWGMLLGAVAALLVLHPAPAPLALARAKDLALVLLVIVFGTVVPFSLYVNSLRRLPAGESALLANSEPVAAAVAAYLWLHVRLGPWALAGALVVLTATTALYLGGRAGATTPPEPEATPGTP